VFDVPAAREVFADLGVPAEAAAELLSMFRQLPNVTAADRERWRAETLALNIPAADLARAHKFVTHDPRVADALNRGGLGDHPRVVQEAVRLAREHALRRTR